MQSEPSAVPHRPDKDRAGLAPPRTVQECRGSSSAALSAPL